MKKLLVIWLMLSFITVACSRKKEVEESMSKKVGTKLGQALTDFGKGVGSGVDTKLKVYTELSKNLEKAGIKMTTSKFQDINNEGKGIAAYFIAEKDFKSKLIATALNSENQEIGRSIIELNMKADDAEYIYFVFNSEMDMQLVEKFLIDIKK